MPGKFSPNSISYPSFIIIICVCVFMCVCLCMHVNARRQPNVLFTMLKSAIFILFYV